MTSFNFQTLSRSRMTIIISLAAGIAVLFRSFSFVESRRETFYDAPSETSLSSPLHPKDMSSFAPNFRVITVTDNVFDTISCGGCTALHQLAEELRSHGMSVETISWDTMKKTRWDCNIQGDTVVIFSEGIEQSCKVPPRLTIRWILAPMGAVYQHSVTSAWSQNDWVYNYGKYAPGVAGGVPDENLLTVLRNPYRGDEFDIPQPHSSLRKGTCYTSRKQHLFHRESSITWLHTSDDTPLAETISESVKQFLVHEFFVSYDPYTFLTFIAAWEGCVPIVHPLGNLTKREWILSTAWGPYVRLSKRDVLMDGVAYGSSPDEIERARRTLPLMRKEFELVKEWGRGTVSSFIEDVLSHLSGKEPRGRRLVSDFYPPGWNPGKITAK